MRLAVVAAGFTPGEADQLRRAMGAWRRPGVIEQFRQKLIDGMLARGLSAEFAENVFQQISGFGEYGFPESHAASFALLVYVSAWLKHYYPAAFAAALLNSQPMGFYAPAQLVRDAREHGVEVRPVDVNHSHWDCTLEARSRACEADTGNDSATPRTQRPKASIAPRHAFAAGAAWRCGGKNCRGARRGAVSTRLTISPGEPAWVGRCCCGWPRQMPCGRWTLDRRTGLWQALAEESQTRAMPLFDHLSDRIKIRSRRRRCPP